MSFGCKMAICNAKTLCCVLLVLSNAASFPTKAPGCQVDRHRIARTFSLNKSHNFSCRVSDGSLASTISWKINGTVIKKSDKPSNWLSLSLSDKSTSGTLRCEAKINRHDIACEVKLSDFPRITTHLHFYEVFVGNRLVVPCKSTGNPKPSLTWTKREKLLPDPTVSQSITLKKSRDGLDLVISKASKAHDDVYMCRSANVLGEDTHHALVSVLYNVPQHPPRVLPLPQTITVRNGSSVFLACSVNNAPKKYAVLFWELHGTRIQNSKRFQIKDQYTVKIYQNTYKIERALMSLVIDHVTPRDAGEYKCRAVTHVGLEEAHVNLIVKG